jgi:four helix bundle protein
MERKNITVGSKKLRVWQDAVSLYIMACTLLRDFPFELKRVASNSLDAAHSISKNISEGYCRRSLRS